MVFIICVLAIGITFVFTRMRKVEDYSNYDVYKMISDISKIPNISLDIVRYPENESSLKFYKKDNMREFIGNSEDTSNKKIIEIFNSDTNKIVIYNPDTKIGFKTDSKKVSILTILSNSYISDYQNIINMKDDLEYEIEKDNVDGIKCIKVTFKVKEKQNIYAILWFELDNNLVIKAQGSEDDKTFTRYENIKLNCVTDKEFLVPSDIKIETTNN